MQAGISLRGAWSQQGGPRPSQINLARLPRCDIGGRVNFDGSRPKETSPIATDSFRIGTPQQLCEAQYSHRSITVPPHR